jgi:hypothetical protein
VALGPAQRRIDFAERLEERIGRLAEAVLVAHRPMLPRRRAKLQYGRPRVAARVPGRVTGDLRILWSQHGFAGSFATMGWIINVRGPSGSGKTHLAREIMAACGWRRPGAVEPLYRARRRFPILYRIAHPIGGRRLAVVGHYERRSGGSDTIRRDHGGLDEVFRLAAAYGADHDVFVEGLALSEEHRQTSALAALHPVYVVRLTTPVSECVGNLLARQHRGRRQRPALERRVRDQARRIDTACAALDGRVRLERLGFDEAVARVTACLRL